MVTNPFSIEDLREIDECIQLCDDLTPLMHKAEACNEDCKSRKETISSLRNKLEAYKREFFPGGRPWQNQ